MSGAFDKSILAGNTLSFKIKEENDKHRYLYFGGDIISSFLTNDDIYKNISNTGKNLTPCSIAISKEKIYFLTPHLEFNKRDKVDDKELLKTNKK